MTAEAPSIWETAKLGRAELAQRNYAKALDRVRRAEQEAELALTDLEKAHREVVKEARFEPVAQLSPMFEMGWNERRVRLMAETL